MPVPLPKAILGVEEAGSATGNEKQWDGTKSHKLGCVYFQEPEFSELKSVQPSNHGIYLPPDTQEHAGSGRASSMPRLTVDPQVKSNYLPYAVASWAVLNWWVMEKTSAMFRWALDLPPRLPCEQNLAHGPSLHNLLLHTCFPWSPKHNSLQTQPAMHERLPRISAVYFSFLFPFLAPQTRRQFLKHTQLCVGTVCPNQYRPCLISLSVFPASWLFSVCLSYIKFWQRQEVYVDLFLAAVANQNGRV